MRKFFVVWTGQAFSLLGSALVQFALAWYLTKQTGSAAVLATATLVALLPQVLAGPFIGALVDRWDRKRIMMVADAGIALVTAGLVALFALGVVQPWHIYVAALARGIGQTFHFPAMQAATSLLVPREHLARVAGLNQGLQGAISVVAPPLGAVALAVMPMPAVLALDIGTAALAISCLAAVAVPRPSAAGAAELRRPGVLADMAVGFRYVLAWPGLVLLLAMAAFINFFLLPTQSLQPILVVKHFGAGALQLSWMEAAFGIGLVAGGIALGAWGGFKRKMLTSLLGVSLAGAAIGAIGLVPSGLLPVAIALMLVSGVALSMANGPLFAIMQGTVAKDMQGRVFTLLGSVSGAMMPLGLAVAGPVADAVGVRVWYVVAGAATLLVAGAGRFVPSLMRIEEHAAAAAMTAAGGA